MQLHKRIKARNGKSFRDEKTTTKDKNFLNFMKPSTPHSARGILNKGSNIGSEKNTTRYRESNTPANLFSPKSVTFENDNFMKFRNSIIS